MAAGVVSRRQETVGRRQAPWHPLADRLAPGAAGELPAHQLHSGPVMVAVPPTSRAVRPQQGAVSARVSSTEHHNNLDCQAERVSAWCAANGWPLAKGSRRAAVG